MIHSPLPSSVFAERRQRLLAQLPQNSSVILFAPSPAQRNGDVSYPFRQNSDFWYFTGFPEAEAVAVLSRKNGQDHYTLFSTRRQPEQEIWSGKIIGQQKAVEEYGADQALPLSELSTLPSLLGNAQRLYTILNVDPATDQRITALAREIHALSGRGGAELEGLFDLRRITDDMRLFKSLDEQNLLHEAGRISAAGHRAAMLAAQPGAYEYTAQAAMEAEFRRQKGCHWAFPSIIAGGENACCLHYQQNNAPLKDGDLVLFDGGAEYAGYAGDISRTIPVNGKFSRDQQALYEVVLNAQKAAIAAARPGIRHLDLHRQTTIDLMQGLIDLKIIDGNAEELTDSGDAKRYYPHGTGHWLGLDVHDVGVYKPDGKSRLYAPDMVITIEPGVYLQPDDTSIAEKWRGIGIRIEDDIIITNDEPEITTSGVPKSVREIEALLATRG